MREVAVIMDISNAASEPGNHIDIRNVRTYQHDGGGTRRRIAESGSCEEQSHQRMCQVIQ